MTLEQSIQAIQDIMHYRSHPSWCEINSTDFCTCGLRDAVIDARKAMSSILKIVNDLQGTIKQQDEERLKLAKSC